MFYLRSLVWLLAFPWSKADESGDSCSLLQTASSIYHLHSVPGHFFEDTESTPSAAEQNEARRQLFEEAPVPLFDVGKNAVPLPKLVDERPDVRPIILAQAEASSDISKVDNADRAESQSNGAAAGDSTRFQASEYSQARNEFDKVGAEVSGQAPSVHVEPPQRTEAISSALETKSTLAEKIEVAIPSQMEVQSAEPPLFAESQQTEVDSLLGTKSGETNDVQMASSETPDTAIQFVECLGGSSEADCTHESRKKKSLAILASQPNPEDKFASQGEWRNKLARLKRQKAKLDAMTEISMEEKSLSEAEKTSGIMLRRLDALEKERRRLLDQAVDKGWLRADYSAAPALEDHESDRRLQNLGSQSHAKPIVFSSLPAKSVTFKHRLDRMTELLRDRDDD